MNRVEREEQMNSRERVLTAMDHEEPDRVPIDIGGFSASSLTIGAYRKLADFLNLQTEPKFFDHESATVIVNDQILDKFGVDTRPACRGVTYSSDHFMERVSTSSRKSFTDCWGVKWETDASGSPPYALKKGPFTDIRKPSLTDIENHDWPEPEELISLREEDFKNAKHYYTQGKAVILWLPIRTLSRAQFLRGIDLFLMDCIRYPNFAEALVAKSVEIGLEATEMMLEKFGKVVDIVGWSDDMGTTRGPMLSPGHYRKLLKPYQKKIVTTIKKNSEAKVLLHSDGSLYELIGDFVEIGIDALNPVQHNMGNVKDMRPHHLKREFGKHITFWGGIDTSRILPFGSPSDVKKEVKRRIEELSKNGGYILSSVHNIQQEVPPENIIAMLEAAREFGTY